MNRKSKIRKIKRRLYNSHSDNKFTIVHSNIRGFSSKCESMKHIARSADVVTINETFMKGKAKPNLPGFQVYSRNGKSFKSGGIATCVSFRNLNECLKLFEGDGEDEIIITRHGQFSVALNIFNVYGAQEKCLKRDDILRAWENMLKEIRKIEEKGELICILGDFNRQVGDAVPGNRVTKASFGGKLVRELLDTGKYFLVNATDKVVGGPYTRCDPGDPFNDEKKSVLDLCIVSKELFPFVEKMIIDSDRGMTPFRPLSAGRRIYTDHYTICLVLK